MKQSMITKDCYVDVSGWSEDEVKKAAEIFKDSVEGYDIDNIEVRPEDGYKYLMFLGGIYVFVGSMRDILEHGRATEVSKEQVFMASRESTKQTSGMRSSTTTLQRIQTFTMNHKNLEISFENGMITARDWKGNGEPIEYKFDTIEQLEELMCAWEKLCKFKVEN